MQNTIKETYTFTGCIEIINSFSHSETSEILGKALTTPFEFDLSGNWEEYPAYCAYFMGIELALLAPPEPEYDLREVKDNNYQLVVKDFNFVNGASIEIDLTNHLIAIIREETSLKCNSIN